MEKMKQKEWNKENKKVRKIQKKKEKIRGENETKKEKER